MDRGDPTAQRREIIRKFLLVYSHYDKKRLVAKAKQENIFKYSESDEEVYDALKRFSDYHKIKIEQVEEYEKNTEKSKEYIEKIDESGASKLQLISDKNTAVKNDLKTLLLERRDLLSLELLEINKLLKFYE